MELRSRGSTGSRGIGRSAVATVAVTLALACSASPGRSETAALAGADQQDKLVTIQHVAPARDSIGAPPARFEWTPVDGADRYAIGVWNDVDRLLWKNDDVHEASIAKPEALDLDSGTYFWRVAAVRNDRQVADSGWSAFVVRR